MKMLNQLKWVGYSVIAVGVLIVISLLIGLASTVSGPVLRDSNKQKVHVDTIVVENKINVYDTIKVKVYEKIPVKTPEIQQTIDTNKTSTNQ